MKIKYKLSLAICSILVLLGIVLNISTRYIVNEKMEKNITNYLDEIMRSTREAIKYNITTDNYRSKSQALSGEAEYIGNYISLNYECNVDLRDIKGELYWSNIDDKYKAEIEQTLVNTTGGEAIVNLIYTDKGIDGILSYPIYINEKYLGIIDIVKNYDDVYEEYNNMIVMITIMEIITFLTILIATIFLTSRITKPITMLTEDIKRMSNGDYNTSIKMQQGKDEVTILSNEFIKMKEKIGEQINTINTEKDKVETLANSRKNFFDNVTHEIKTPLTAITGYAEMLKDNIVEDEKFKKKAIERIYSESERLNILVLDLINVSKGLSSLKEEKSLIKMDSLINEICDDMKIKSDKYGLSIVRNINKGTIMGQTNKIRELLINIIDNAIKYSLQGEVINVKAGEYSGKYVVEVTNKSEIIPKEIYDNIFEPLVKIKNKKEVQSSGLGLFICKEIVTEHNGVIKIENGNTIKVKIEIPVYQKK